MFSWVNLTILSTIPDNRDWVSWILLCDNKMDPKHRFDVLRGASSKKISRACQGYHIVSRAQKTLWGNGSGCAIFLPFRRFELVRTQLTYMNQEIAVPFNPLRYKTQWQMRSYLVCSNEQLRHRIGEESHRVHDFGMILGHKMIRGKKTMQPGHWRLF